MRDVFDLCELRRVCVVCVDHKRNKPQLANKKERHGTKKAAVKNPTKTVPFIETLPITDKHYRTQRALVRRS